ncbi:MAG: hypothetical protein GIW94_05365 [Candidatus Eremiobacteraeota bacterium]|nr:hypothetical protein [Candidatus Eremiobacteraeota bacterium]
MTWPGIVRPLLEGDSLGYHLPNAAAWANAHSLWTTTTTYWWYPPGSELFASALFLIGGPTVLGLAGFVALLLLALRIEAFSRHAGLSPWSAGADAAATVTVPTIGLQGASLQNDVWLGAWVLECLWALEYERAALQRALTICAIIKPIGIAYGIVFAALGLRGIHGTSVRARAVLAPFTLFVIWALHVVILWRDAVIEPGQSAYPHLQSTIILAHGLAGARTFAQALIGQGVGAVVLGATIIVALFTAKTRKHRYLPLILAAFFFIEPFGYDNGVPQLATGMSLRFMIPAFVIGVVGSLDHVKRWSTPIGLAAAALAVFQIRSIIGIFWNYAHTHAIVPIAIAAGILMSVRNKLPTAAVVALGTAILLYGVRQDVNPVGYYDAWLGSNVAPSGLYAWLSRTRPQRVVVSELRGGPVSVVLPGTLVADANSDPCAEARRLRAVVIVAARSHRNCGRRVFADAHASVYEPTDSN